MSPKITLTKEKESKTKEERKVGIERKAKVAFLVYWLLYFFFEQKKKLLYPIHSLHYIFKCSTHIIVSMNIWRFGLIY